MCGHRVLTVQVKVWIGKGGKLEKQGKPHMSALVMSVSHLETQACILSLLISTATVISRVAQVQDTGILAGG